MKLFIATTLLFSNFAFAAVKNSDGKSTVDPIFDTPNAVLFD